MEDNISFERSKIYEKLAYQPMPAGYEGKLPWTVQQQVAATNGIQYIDRIGKLTDYPEFELPVNKVSSGIMLDIGTGWGRWLIAANKKGYIPVGADLRLEFCQTAINTMKAKGVYGYTVVADLKELPFKENCFDLVWSFSVIQHTHKDRMMACLKHIKRILKSGAFLKLEFPNSNGIHNRLGPAKESVKTADDYNSWVVRYYTPAEYKAIFIELFGNFSYKVHSMLGIGVLKEDLKYVSVKNKILCAASLTGTFLARLFKPLKDISDSIYVESIKRSPAVNNSSIDLFLASHQKYPGNNLNIIHLLQCPVSGEGLTLSENKDRLLTQSGKMSYPVVEGIPILIRSEATIHD